MSYPGYPSSGGGYPPPAGSPSNIGFQVPPAGQGQGMPSYPPYPSAGGAGYPMGGPGYPSNTSPYPSNTSQYPSNTSPYPSNTSPYPSNTSPYPPTNVPGPYPSNPSAYPSAAPGSGYPPQSNQSPYPPTSYPAAGGIPPSGGGGGMGYPPATSYPGAAPSAYPGYSPYPTNPPGPASAPYGQAPTGYPGVNPAYPAAAPGYAPGGGGAYPPTSQQNYGTIHPYPGFDPRNDADGLRKAMKGFGTDEKAIIRILANRSYGQRHQIVVTYKTQFGKDLISHLKDELSGNFEDVIVALLIPRTHLLAKHLYKATSGFGTAENTLVEILCTSTNAEIREIHAVYKQQYNSSLERDLKDETYGFFKRLLVSLNMGNRDESTHVDQGRAIQDAQALYQAGQARWGTDESTFNRILVSQSYTQLRAVFQEYQKMSGRSIEHALNNEMSGDVLSGMLAIVACVRNKIAYFAERLHHCMSGAGTHDMTLIRIIVTRSEIDLALIKQEFQRMYGASLFQRITSETSGDYKRVLLDILRD